MIMSAEDDLKRIKSLKEDTCIRCGKMYSNNPEPGQIMSPLGRHLVMVVMGDKTCEEADKYDPV